MGKLIEQPVPTIFQGVSRQPDTARLPGQVEEATNVLMSVISGGFERRSGTARVAALTALTTNDITVYAYERDSSERYVVCVRNGGIQVFDSTGAEHTVNTPDGVAYLTSASPQTDFALATIGDSTVVCNRTVKVLMAAAGSGVIKGTKQTWADLPTTGMVVGDIWRVSGKDTDKFTGYLVRWDGAVWRETVDPNAQNSFDPATMPHVMTRNGDGTFTFKRATWKSRLVGDATITPAPDFVNHTINDVAFFMNHLVIAAEETAFFSQPGDFFNMWPDKSIDQTDSDPFGRTASSSRVNILNFIVPFRQALFCTSDKEQFEVSTVDDFTPNRVTMKLATSYRASSRCRPLAQGDTLYFVADSGTSAVVQEYFYDDAAISNTAVNVTAHCLGYIQGPIIQMSGDTTHGVIVAVSSAVRDTLYIYRTFWQNNEKVQSAWAKFILPGAYIVSAHFMNGLLYLVTTRSGAQYLETLVVTDAPGSYDPYTITSDQVGPWPIRLDFRFSATGVYDAANDWTTWTSPSVHANDLIGVLGSWSPNKGLAVSGVTYPTSTTMRRSGNYSGGAVIWGKAFDSTVQFSRLFAQENDGRAITSGRLQLRKINLDYRNSATFDVEVTPEARTTRVNRFVARVLGTSYALVGQPSIDPLGTFHVRINSRADTVKIVVKSSSHLPMTVTAMSWLGFFNELSRQEA